MKTYYKFYYSLAIVAITLMMASSPIFAADNAQGIDSKKIKVDDKLKTHENYKNTIKGDYSMKGGYSILGSKFIGLNIENSQGDNIGEVKDIMLDSMGMVRYVAVSYGGFLGMGKNMYTVPMDAFIFQRDTDSIFADTKLLLNVTEEQLKGDKGFDTDHWPNLDDEGYRNDLDKRYNIDRSSMNNTRKMHENYKGTMKGGYSILGSKFIGLDIENPQGDNIGEVKDIMLDSTGRVRYVAVSYGGFLGMGKNMYTVPMDAFSFQRDTDSFFTDTKLLLNVTEEQLKDDKGFDTGNWPNLEDEGYRNDLDKRYNIDRDRLNINN